MGSDSSVGLDVNRINDQIVGIGTLVCGIFY